MSWWRRAVVSRSRRSHEAGAAVVEAAVVAPLVMLALLGVIESALAWRDQVALVDAAGEAARVAALYPSTIPGWTSEPSAFTGIEAVVAAVAGGIGPTRAASVERIVVFTPDGPSGRSAVDAVPDRCRNDTEAGVADRCVIVGPGGSGAGNQAADCGGGGGGGSCVWRQADADGVMPRYVGVYVRMHREWFVPGLGAAGTSEAAVITALEGGGRAR